MDKEEFDLARKTVVVKDNDCEYEFRIPTILDEVKIGTRMRRLRMAADPMDDPGGSIDPDTMAYLKAMAYFEVLLLAADNSDWVWSRSNEGKRFVDSTKFPEDKTDLVLRVASKAFWSIARFRSGDVSSGESDNKVVADQPSVQ
jgi:hypothetical protein